MKMNKTVYCDYSFLKDFLKSCPKHNDDPLVEDPVISWIKVYQFLYTSATYLNISKSQFVVEALKDKDLMKFFKACTNMNFFEKDFPFREDKDYKRTSQETLNSVYLSSLNKFERAELSSTLGIIVLGKQDVTEFIKQHEEKTIAIPKGSHFSSWDEIEFPEQAKKSNSMVIVDNYILDDTTKIKANLGSILDVLLPNELLVDYHILVFGILKGTKKSLTEKDAERRYQLLNDEIKRIRPQLKYKLSIFNSSEFHDRIIITNNVWIDCGGGFDLFNNGKACKRTNLRFAFPFLINCAQSKSWINEAFVYLIKDCIRVFKQEHKYKYDYWGEETYENRLLSYYSQKVFEY